MGRLKDFFRKIAKAFAEQKLSVEGLPVYTPRAQQVMQLAREEAKRLNHDCADTEHVLLGLIRLGQGVAVNVLKRQGVDLEKARTEVEKLASQRNQAAASTSADFAPPVKKVLVSAHLEAKALCHSYVGTEHILLGLLCEGSGSAARVLKSLHLDIDELRGEILKELDPNFDPENREKGG